MSAYPRSLAVLMGLVVGLGLIISAVPGLTGPAGMLALSITVAGSLLVGYMLCGRDPAIRSAMGLGGAQRDASTALVAAARVDRGHHVTSGRREEIVSNNF